MGLNHQEKYIGTWRMERIQTGILGGQEHKKKTQEKKAQSTSGTWISDLAGVVHLCRGLVRDNLGQVCWVKPWKALNSRQGSLNLSKGNSERFLREEQHNGSISGILIGWWCAEWTEGKEDRLEWKKLIRRQWNKWPKQEWEGQRVRKMMKKE